ncbi:acyl-CoA thioesterase [Treponema sp. R6D11]
MFSIKVTPRFGDIDALGHVNNTALPAWFELARRPIMQIFVPDLIFDKNSFPLIMAHNDFDYEKQIFFKSEVEIKTWISKIGTKSFTVYHEAWQDGQRCTKGNCVVVYFVNGQSTPLPDDIKKKLSEHMIN